MNQNTQEAYKALSAEFYDLDPTYPPEKEVAFLTTFMRNSVPGPWLEAMSGSGRILIPLLQHGFVVEGVDNSPAMLARCKERMRLLALNTPIYEQSVVDLALPKKYSGIIVCFASLQLLPDRAHMIYALQRFKEHLVPGGMLLIDIFVPWSSIKRAIVGGDLIPHVRIEDAPAQWVRDADGLSIERRAVLDVYAGEQYVVVHNKYIKRAVYGDIVATESEEMRFAWYYRYEMALILEEIGFTQINIIDQNEEMIAYQALL